MTGPDSGIVTRLAVAALVLLSGCAGLAAQPSTTTPEAPETPTPTAAPTPSPTPTAPETSTATQTGTVPAVDGFDATAADAARLQAQIDDSVSVGVEAIGGLALMWEMPSANVSVPNSSANTSKMSRTEKELLVIIRDYLALTGAGQINGSLSLTGVHDGERVLVWSIEEQWVREFHNDQMTATELLSKIRDTRYDMREEEQ